VEKEQKIEAFFNDVAGFSTTSRDFLQRNGENIIRLGELSVPQLNLYAKYAPEYPCLLEGIVRAIPRQAETFRGHTLHINLEVLPRQPRGFTAADAAVYGDQRGPHDTDLCRRAINGEWHQGNLPPDFLVPNIVDGVDEPVGKGESPNRTAPGPAVEMTSGYAGTRAEQGVVDSVAAPVLDVPVSEVPDLATLLFGPIARGTEVSLR
jgi:phospholipid/cholesterol/gamma-HCH transport system substrate-binding protein